MIEHLCKEIEANPNTKFQFTFVNGSTATYMIKTVDQMGLVGVVTNNSVPVYMPWANIIKIVP